MSRLISRTVDKKMITEIISDFDLPKKHVQFVVERLEGLLEYIQLIEKDIEADKVKDTKGRRPQDRREMLSRIAGQLDDIKSEMDVFREPNLRYWANPQFPRTRPIGLSEFREAFSLEFTSVLSLEYISKFGMDPVQWNYKSTHSRSNDQARAEAINWIAENIFENILKKLSLVLRETEMLIAKHTPKGGRRASIIEDMLLVNVVAIAHEIFGPTKKLSYNRGETKFFKFCQGLCRAVDAGNLCTETYLRIAVADYKKRENLP